MNAVRSDSVDFFLGTTTPADELDTPISETDMQ